MQGKGAGPVNRVELESQVLCAALRQSWHGRDKIGSFTSVRELSHLFPDLLPPPEEKDSAASSNKANYYDVLNVKPQSPANGVIAHYLRTVKAFLRVQKVKESRGDFNRILNAGFILRKPRLRLSHDLVVVRRWLLESQEAAAREAHEREAATAELPAYVPAGSYADSLKATQPLAVAPHAEGTPGKAPPVPPLPVAQPAAAQTVVPPVPPLPAGQPAAAQTVVPPVPPLPVAQPAAAQTVVPPVPPLPVVPPVPPLPVAQPAAAQTVVPPVPPLPVVPPVPPLPPLPPSAAETAVPSVPPLPVVQPSAAETAVPPVPVMPPAAAEVALASPPLPVLPPVAEPVVPPIAQVEAVAAYMAEIPLASAEAAISSIESAAEAPAQPSPRPAAEELFVFDESQLRKPEVKVALPMLVQLLEAAQFIGPLEVQALKAQMQLAPNIPVEKLILNAGYVTAQEMNSLKLGETLLHQGKITMAQFQVAIYDERTSGLRMAESLQVRGWLNVEVRNAIDEWQRKRP